MQDVFFYETFAEEGQALKLQLPPHLKAGFSWKTIQETGDQTPPAALISIRTQSLIPPAWTTQLSGILTRSTGYDHIHRYWQQVQLKTPCGYLPLYCHRAVAEQTMLLWMTLLRKLPQQLQQFNTFQRDHLTGQESLHQTLLVVGVGNIGYEVVQIGTGLGMTVLGIDIDPKYPNVSYTSIAEGLPQADIVVCAMNLTPDNRGYFNYQLLKRAKRGTIFINIARGELSPTADLLRLLEEHWLGGVALDVYENESELAVTLRHGLTPKSEETEHILELAKYPNVLLTPHNAFNTQEALARKAHHSILQVNQFLETGYFLWSVPSVK
jgi:D-lactate dehydrogenase